MTFHKILASLALMGAVAFAEDQPFPSTTMTEVQSRDVIILQQGAQVNAQAKHIADLEGQIADLKEQIRKFQQDATIKAICEDKKIPVAQCEISTDGSNRVTKRPEVQTGAKP